MRNCLTEAQRQILTDLTNERRYEEGWATSQWIAESCGHAYDTSWVSGKLTALARRGLIEKPGHGYVRITPAGRSALALEERDDG